MNIVCCRRIKLLLHCMLLAALCTSGCFFSIVLLPDTQHYSEYDFKTYLEQMKWITEHRKEYNIKFVIHLGDITHGKRNDTNGDWDTEWARASMAHWILDLTKMPYSVLPGNHDNPKWGYDGRNTKKYNKHFGPGRFNNNSWYGGSYPQDQNDNNYCYIKTTDPKLMVINLEWAPRDGALKWASDIIKQHSDYNVIIATHCYQNKSGGLQDNCACKYNVVGNEAQEIWDKLVSKHSNIFLVVSGHINGSVIKKQERAPGDSVLHILTDFQEERSILLGPPNGNGWLRLLTFVPYRDSIISNVINVKGEGIGFNQSGYLDQGRTAIYFEM